MGFLCIIKQFLLKAVACVFIVVFVFSCSFFQSPADKAAEYAKKQCESEFRLGEKKEIGINIKLSRKKYDEIKSELAVGKRKEILGKLEDFDSKWDSLYIDLDRECKIYNSCKYLHTEEGSCLKERAKFDSAKQETRKFYKEVSGFPKTIEELKKK